MHDPIEVLEEGRRREKSQTLVYRALAAEAEAEDLPDLGERLNGLHADEQHHLSRLTARLLELGGRPDDLRDISRPSVTLEGWEVEAREREREEVAWYERALSDATMDDETREVLEEILESERQHEKILGGKWMPA
jgi:rubrerythrin